MTDLPLAASFAPASHHDWVKKAELALKGASLDKLTKPSRDGIPIAPLYDRSETPAIAARAGGLAWQLVQRVDAGDPVTANAFALEDLLGGANALALTFAGAHSARGFGLRDATAGTLDLALKDVAVYAIGLRFEPGPQWRDIPTAMLRLAEMRSLSPARLDVNFGLDPLCEGEGLAEAAKLLRGGDFGGALVNADGRIFHDAGATEAQELGFALHRALKYLRALDGDAAAISFTLSASPDMFLTLAKFRALRLLWARVCEAAGLPNAHVALHGETSFRHLTRTDPHVNLLRAVAGVFGAGLGGADSVSVLPFTAASGLADGFARRLARNAQVMLVEESNLHRVGDPAAGSGYLSTLTDQLAEKAWSIMQEATRGADISAAITKSHEAQMARVAKRAEPITGTSEFPNVKEVLAPSPDSAMRLSEPFEVLREAAQATKPCVRLVTLGRIADFTARAQWAQNLIASGGVGVDESARDVAIICGSDEAYAAEIGEAVRELKAAGVQHIWIAGKPGVTEAVSHYLHAGMDVIAALKQFHAQLGIGSK
jgi:methylmalonyl-CoA mutase